MASEQPPTEGRCSICGSMDHSHLHCYGTAEPGSYDPAKDVRKLEAMLTHPSESYGVPSRWIRCMAAEILRLRLRSPHGAGTKPDEDDDVEIWPGCEANDTGYHRLDIDGQCSDCDEQVKPRPSPPEPSGKPITDGPVQIVYGPSIRAGQEPLGIRDRIGFLCHFNRVNHYEGQEERYREELALRARQVEVIAAALNGARAPEPAAKQRGRFVTWTSPLEAGQGFVFVAKDEFGPELSGKGLHIRPIDEGGIFAFRALRERFATTKGADHG